MAKIGIIGAGSWGTALAVHLSGAGHKVTVWSIDEKEINMLKEDHEQLDKLPGVTVPESVIFTTDIWEAVSAKDIVVLAVPSVFVRSTAAAMEPYISFGQLIVVVSKGIEESSLMILTDVVTSEIPKCNAAVLSGPSHAEEVGRGLPTTVVAGASDKKTAEYIQSVFMTDVFRVYTSPDMLGIELGAALKNVIALAAGMADGLGFGDNTKAALITRGIAEMTRLAIAMGAEAETLSGLSGIGDLIVTCASMHSRNRRAGILIGKGYTAKQAMDEVKMVVEGVYSAKAAMALAEKYGVEMPITEQVNEVLFNGKTAKEGVADLMLRDKKSETESARWQSGAD